MRTCETCRHFTPAQADANRACWSPELGAATGKPALEPPIEFGCALHEREPERDWRVQTLVAANLVQGLHRTAARLNRQAKETGSATRHRVRLLPAGVALEISDESPT